MSVDGSGSSSVVVSAGSSENPSSVDHLTVGATNTLLGQGAGGALNAEAATNTVIGVNALASSTTGDNNTVVGYMALNEDVGVGNNTAIGIYAMRYNQTGDECVAVGRNALHRNIDARENTAVGYDALNGNTRDVTGGANTAVGHSALESNGSGVSNTAVGRGALNNNASGGSNTAVGRDALLANSTGHSNTAVGKGALQSQTGQSAQTAVGNTALSSSAGADNTAVGYAAGYVPGGLSADNATTTGARNVFLGAECGFGAPLQSNDTVAVGWRALVNDTASGAGAVAVGSGAWCKHSRSVALGYQTISTANDQVELGGRHVEVSELSADPAAPAANAARWYVKDNGAGKTQLCVRFATGAVQVIATEP